ncbi:MAG: protein kinase [Ktedonobacterales bacterium]|nr:protein kinase [Ktedonobacterales bacterium]
MDIRCERCGREAPPDAQFCPACGAVLDAFAPVPATGRLAPRYLLHNRYLILNKLAQGGQSAVYHALDTLEGGAERAIKEMSESDLSPQEREKAINGFMREARMLYTLQHPGLAQVYEVFVEGHKHYLVMEYVPGHNLEDELMKAGRPLEWERVVRWGMELCDLFTYLHTQQPPIIYRDLKPPNVMLTPNGAMKLIDFGIARWLYPDRQDTAQLGTDGYAPPEQYTAHSEPRSDLYALGATLYHLLTGRVPEPAPQRLGGRQLTPIRTHNPAVPETVERVVGLALALQAQDRFTSAAKMREALEWTLRRSDEGHGQRRLTPPPAAGKRGAPHGSTAGAVAGAHGAALPRLHVAPLRLDAGFIEPEGSRTLTLDLTNRGGGQLTGRTETNLPSLQVTPRTFDERVPSLQVHIDTTGLPNGPYVCHIAIRTNGGDQIVPVRFTVRTSLGSYSGRP